MSSLSVLSKQHLEHLFSKDQYQKECQKKSSMLTLQNKLIPSHELKFVLILDENDDRIYKYIQNLKNNQPDQINSKFTEYQITPLHIAIMRGREVIVKALIEARADVNSVDKYGWTPLHHASLVSNDLMQLLLASGADVNAKTHSGGTYQDIRRLVGIEKAADRALLFYKTLDAKEPKKIQIDALSARLKIEYVDECRWPENLLYSLWTSSLNGFRENPLQSHIKTEVYPLLTQNPPKIIIAEEKVTKEGSIYRDIKAGEDIEPFRLIGEYSGEIIRFRNRIGLEGAELTYSYMLEDTDDGYTISINAQNKGNWTRYINDGFPNIVVIPLFNTAGQKRRILFFSIDLANIKENESLFYDYSCNFYTLKWGHYILGNKQKMREFFKNFFDFCKELESKYKDLNKYSFGDFPYVEYIAFKGLEAQLLYLFQTPMALIDLVFSQTINIDKLFIFMRTEQRKPESLFYEVLNESNSSHAQIYDLARLLREVDLCLNKLSVEDLGMQVALQFRQLFLNHEDILSVNGLKKKIEETITFFNNKFFFRRDDFTVEEIQKIALSLESELAKLFS